MRPRFVSSRQHGAALCLAGSVLIVAAGCGNVLGLDRYEIDDSAGGSAQGGNGAAGQGGFGGSAGGTSGSGGSGGFSNCDGISEPNWDIVRSCILRTSCSPFVPNVTVSQCVTLNYQSAFLGTSCTLAAQDCDDVGTCQGYGYAGAACDGQSGKRCENNIAYDCDGNVFLDCGTQGGNCVYYDSNGDNLDDSVGCKVTDCADPNGTQGCSGNTYYTCIDGEGIGAACSAVQAECRTQGTQTGCFLKTRDTCTTSGVSCDANVAKVCSGGSLLEFDCNSVGLNCSDDPAGTYCAAAGCTTEQVAACEESCNGSVMNICYGGVPFAVDCQAYGFSSCRTFEHPDTKLPFALCL